MTASSSRLTEGTPRVRSPNGLSAPDFPSVRFAFHTALGAGRTRLLPVRAGGVAQSDRRGDGGLGSARFRRRVARRPHLPHTASRLSQGRDAAFRDFGGSAASAAVPTAAERAGGQDDVGVLVAAARSVERHGRLALVAEHRGPVARSLLERPQKQHVAQRGEPGHDTALELLAQERRDVVVRRVLDAVKFHDREAPGLLRHEVRRRAAAEAAREPVVASRSSRTADPCRA